MSNAIIYDPKSWGAKRDDPIARLLVRAHAELGRVFADAVNKENLHTLMNDSATITITLVMMPPY